MVVRPEEVGELNREEQRAKETLEKEIDEYLLDFDGDGVCKFYFKYDKEITKRVRKKFKLYMKLQDGRRLSSEENILKENGLNL